MAVPTVFCPHCGVALEKANARTCKVCGTDVRAARAAAQVEEVSFSRLPVGAEVEEPQADRYSSDSREAAYDDDIYASGVEPELDDDAQPFSLSVLEREGLTALPATPPQFADVGETVRGHIRSSGISGVGSVALAWQKKGWVVGSHDQLDDDIWVLEMRYDPSAAAAHQRRARLIMIAVGIMFALFAVGVVLAMLTGAE